MILKCRAIPLLLSFGAMVLLSELASGDVVSQWSFESNLDDTAPSGGTADHLDAFALNEPLDTVFVPGIVGQAVQVGSEPGDATVLEVFDSDDLNLAAEFTVEAFVQRTLEHGAEWDRFATKWFDGTNDWHWAFRQPPNKSQDLFMNGIQQINQGVVTTDVELDTWYHVAMTGDPVNGLRLWQNGRVVGNGPYEEPIPGTDSFRIGNLAVDQTALQFHGWVDEFMIHDVSQTETYMAGRTELLLTDNPDADPDEDGLTNAEELVIGTDPDDPDTDDDGLLDGMESLSGVWGGAANPGTSPLLRDSDKDGLDDGVENPDLPYVDANQPGTDPNIVDSDDDGASDGVEIQAGTDPTDPNDTPTGMVVAKWSFEGDLVDSAPAGANPDNLTDNTDIGVSYVPGVIGQAVAIPSTIAASNKLTASASADLDLAADWTLELFVWPDLDNDPFAEWERIWTRWGEGGNVWHIATRGNDGAPTPDGIDLFLDGANVIPTESTVSLPRETWSHLAFVADQTADTITAWLNGEEVGSGPWEEIDTTTGSMNFGNFAGGDQSTLQFSGYIDEALIHNVAVSESYLLGRARLLLGEPTRIIDIRFDGSEAVITWTSQVGLAYALDWSSDLIQWFNIDDFIPGREGTTSFTDETILPGTRNRYYRVGEP